MLSDLQNSKTKIKTCLFLKLNMYIAESPVLSANLEGGPSIRWLGTACPPELARPSPAYIHVYISKEIANKPANYTILYVLACSIITNAFFRSDCWP